MKNIMCALMRAMNKEERDMHDNCAYQEDFDEFYARKNALAAEYIRAVNAGEEDSSNVTYESHSDISYWYDKILVDLGKGEFFTILTPVIKEQVGAEELLCFLKKIGNSPIISSFKNFEEASYFLQWGYDEYQPKWSGANHPILPKKECEALYKKAEEMVEKEMECREAFLEKVMPDLGLTKQKASFLLTPETAGEYTFRFSKSEGVNRQLADLIRYDDGKDRSASLMRLKEAEILEIAILLESGRSVVKALSEHEEIALSYGRWSFEEYKNFIEELSLDICDQFFYKDCIRLASNRYLSEAIQKDLLRRVADYNLDLLDSVVCAMARHVTPNNSLFGEFLHSKEFEQYMLAYNPYLNKDYVIKHILKWDGKYSGQLGQLYASYAANLLDNYDMNSSDIRKIYKVALNDRASLHALVKNQNTPGEILEEVLEEAFHRSKCLELYLSEESLKAVVYNKNMTTKAFQFLLKLELPEMKRVIATEIAKGYSVAPAWFLDQVAIDRDSPDKAKNSLQVRKGFCDPINKILEVLDKETVEKNKVLSKEEFEERFQIYWRTNISKNDEDYLCLDGKEILTIESSDPESYSEEILDAAEYVHEHTLAAFLLSQLGERYRSLNYFQARIERIEKLLMS